MRTVLRVVSKGDCAPNAQHRWLEQARGRILCSYCGKINRALYPDPINIGLTEVPDGTLTHVWYIGIRVFRRDFIRRLEPHMTDYVLGKCYDENESLIRSYVTCYMQKYIVVRGQKGSDYELCPECNAVRSSGTAPHYVPLSYVKDGLVFMDSSCNIYIDYELCRKLKLDDIRDVEFDTIPVQERVVDGQHLPIDP
jgi:hypothetical protein